MQSLGDQPDLIVCLEHALDGEQGFGYHTRFLDLIEEGVGGLDESLGEGVASQVDPPREIGGGEEASESEYPSPAEVAAALKADPGQDQSTEATEPAETEKSKGVRETT